MGVIQTLDGLMNNPVPEGRVDDILRPENMIAPRLVPLKA